MSQNEPPQDLTAETAILGGLLLDNDLFYEDAEDLTSDDFYLNSHKAIYALMSEILLGEIPGVNNLDIITLQGELQKRNQVAFVGGTAYLAQLTEGLPRRPNIRQYVVLVKEMAKKRRLAKIGADLHANAMSQSYDSTVLIEQINRHLTDLEVGESDGAVKAGDVTADIKERLLKKRNQSLDRVELEMTWGIEILDQKTKGIFGGELTVIGGESGGGKTAAIAQMAVENGLKGTPVHIFSIEMNRAKFVQRFYPLMSMVITASLMRDPRGMTLHTHVPELDKIAEKIKRLPIYVDDTAPLTLSRMLAKIKKSIRHYNTKLFMVDYLQLIQVPGMKDLQKLEAVMFSLKDFFKKKENEERHLILLSQYAKEQGIAKGRKRRTRGDLHGGAVIHQACQNVLLITVESPDKKDPGSNLDVELMMDKQREGVTGRFVCQRDSESLRFIPAPPESEKKPDEPRKRGRPRKDGGGTQSASEDAIRDDPG
jgi:replicative DNA helicase